MTVAFHSTPSLNKKILFEKINRHNGSKSQQTYGQKWKVPRFDAEAFFPKKFLQEKR